jgi:hypothetical protein
LEDINSRIANFRADHEARVQLFNGKCQLRRAGVITEEKCDAFKREVDLAMLPWRIYTAELNLMAMEDTSKILPEERSTVTAFSRGRTRKNPDWFVSTTHGKYRWAKGHGPVHDQSPTHPWNVPAWYDNIPGFDGNDC